MTLSEIRKKNRKETTLLGSKITKQLDAEDAKTVRNFFEKVVQPTNRKAFDKYIQSM